VVDPETGALVVTGETKRLARDEVVMVRQALAAGQLVVFPDRHRWRHFQVR
jgi:hypothetical protein